MRLFSDPENLLLKEFVEYKEEGNLKELQVARLLRKELSFIALKWEVSPKPMVSVYSLPKKEYKENLSLYFSILNFVYFIQELEKIGFIKLLILPSEQVEKQQILYDKKTYEFKPEKNQFINKELNTEDSILSLMKDYEYQIFDKKDDFECANPLMLQTITNSFAFDLDSIAYKIIYPMPVLEDYVNNGFKTLEDKRYQENHRLALRSVKLSDFTLLISACALGVSLLSALITYKIGREQIETPTEISSNQIEIIDSIISAHSLTNPIDIKTPVEIVSKDTITVLPITK